MASAEYTLTLLETLVVLGFTIKVQTKKVVRDGKDVTIVSVDVDEFTGEGLTASEALSNALNKMRNRIEKRAARDRETLAALAPPPPEPITLR